jgi:4-diphosphocytidyl-2-C-methyl-D-erythritol kinase
MKLKTFAKINLSLLVYKPRKNGYHPLCSVFQAIDLFDTLTIQPTKKIEIEISSNNSSVPINEKNILSNIFYKLKPSLTYGYKIHIEKRIPIGGGLGGGSSNAAGFITALNHYEKWEYSQKKLSRLSLPFGADIPFFFQGPTALIRGIGEKIQTLPSKENLFFVILNPHIHCSTPEIFKLYDNNKGLKSPTKTPTSILNNHFGPNDLLPIVCKLYPEIQHLYKTLKLKFPNISMSGTGSTFFIPCSSQLEATSIENESRRQFPSYFIKSVSSCPQSIYSF